MPGAQQMFNKCLSNEWISYKWSHLQYKHKHSMWEWWGRGAVVSVTQNQKVQAAGIPSGFILWGCQKWLGPGDLNKFTTVERGKCFVEGEECKCFVEGEERKCLVKTMILNICIYWMFVLWSKAQECFFLISSILQGLPQSLYLHSCFPWTSHLF